MASLENHRMFLLKATKYGEADLIVSGLLSTGAKISAIARGALKSKKRFNGGVLEPTHYVELVLRAHRNPEAGLATIEEAKLLEGFEGLRSSYERIEAALKVVEVIDHSAQVGDQNSSELFDLLGAALRALQMSRRVDVTRFQFSLKFLYLQGVLEVEPWMTGLLKNSIQQVAVAEAAAAEDIRLSSDQIRWIDKQVHVYLKTAERSY